MNTFCEEHDEFCLGKKEESSNKKICFSSPDELSGIEFFSSFPPLFLMIGDQTVEWLPSEYFYQWRGFECVGINRGGSQTILGATFMRQKNIVFDLENEQIAIARASCSQDPNRVHIDESILSSNTSVSHVYVNSENSPIRVRDKPTLFSYPKNPESGTNSEISLAVKIGMFGLVLVVFVLLICLCRYCFKESEAEEREEELGDTESESSEHGKKVRDFVAKVRKEDEAVEKSNKRKYWKINDI